jgi:hypothetical protein
MTSALTAIFSTQYAICCASGMSRNDAMKSIRLSPWSRESQTVSTSLLSLRWTSSDATGFRSMMEQRIKIGSQEMKRPMARLWAWILLPTSPKAVNKCQPRQGDIHLSICIPASIEIPSANKNHKVLMKMGTTPLRRLLRRSSASR